MKQIKFITMLLLAVLALSFNACSNDDNDDEDFGNGKRITKIVNEYGNNQSLTFVFLYSNNKLSRYTAFHENNSVEEDKIITYGNNTVAMTGQFDGYGNSVNTVQTFTLDNNGLAISSKIVSSDGGECNYTYQYSEGYLTKITRKYSDESQTEMCTLIYSSGNMTSLQTTYDDNYKFTYSNDKNKGIISPFLMDSDYIFEHIAAYYIGILGKFTNNLIVSSWEETCVYTLDNEEYVKTATLSNGDKFTYTFE